MLDRCSAQVVDQSNIGPGTSFPAVTHSIDSAGMESTASILIRHIS
jgi:hypothetical protein